MGVICASSEHETDDRCLSLCFQPCSGLRQRPQHPHGVQLQHTVPHTHTWSLQGHSGGTRTTAALYLSSTGHHLVSSVCVHSSCTLFSVHAYCRTRSLSTLKFLQQAGGKTTTGTVKIYSFLMRGHEEANAMSRL